MFAVTFNESWEVLSQLVPRPVHTALLQARAWWSAVWSTPTAGTRMRWSACAASARTNTPWVTARCAGPTSWPSSASWTPSSSPWWPSVWAAGRTNCCLRISKWRRKVAARLTLRGSFLTRSASSVYFITCCLKFRHPWPLTFPVLVADSLTGRCSCFQWSASIDVKIHPGRHNMIPVSIPCWFQITPKVREGEEVRPDRVYAHLPSTDSSFIYDRVFWISGSTLSTLYPQIKVPKPSWTSFFNDYCSETLLKIYCNCWFLLCCNLESLQ